MWRCHDVKVSWFRNVRFPLRLQPPQQPNAKERWVPRLFAPGPIRSQERIGQYEPGQFTSWPFHPLALSLTGPFAPWPYRSLELSLSGARWPGPFARGNERSLPGTFIVVESRLDMFGRQQRQSHQAAVSRISHSNVLD